MVDDRATHKSTARCAHEILYQRKQTRSCVRALPWLIPVTPRQGHIGGWYQHFLTSIVAFCPRARCLALAKFSHSPVFCFDIANSTVVEKKLITACSSLASGGQVRHAEFPGRKNYLFIRYIDLIFLCVGEEKITSNSSAIDHAKSSLSFCSAARQKASLNLHIKFRLLVILVKTSFETRSVSCSRIKIFTQTLSAVENAPWSCSLV